MNQLIEYIRRYVFEHQAEYEQWLAEKERRDDNDFRKVGETIVDIGQVER